MLDAEKNKFRIKISPTLIFFCFSFSASHSNGATHQGIVERVREREMMAKNYI